MHQRHSSLLVLGVERPDGTYVATPRGFTVVHAGDRLILYGHEEALRRLDERHLGAAGDAAHVAAMAVVERRQRA